MTTLEDMHLGASMLDALQAAGERHFRQGPGIHVDDLMAVQTAAMVVAARLSARMMIAFPEEEITNRSYREARMSLRTALRVACKVQAGV